MKVLAVTPSRISLFGGGTDVEPYASLYGGICINMAINIRHKIILDDVDDAIVEESYDNPKFFEEITKDMGVDNIGMEHRYENTIESGLGSSASYAVAIVGVINHYKGLGMTRSEIAEKAWDIEVNKLKMYGGKQDQYVTAYGGVNAMEFTKKGVVVTPLSPKFIEPLYPYLLLFNLGFNRKSSKIQEGFKKLTPDKKKMLDALKEYTIQAVDAIGKSEIEKVAELFRKSWEAKKLSNKGVSNDQIDFIYKEGIRQGAMAGKVLGAGSGGHILFMVHPSTHKDFIRSMEDIGLKWIDYSIDWNGLDCRKI